MRFAPAAALTTLIASTPSQADTEARIERFINSMMAVCLVDDRPMVVTIGPSESGPWATIEEGSPLPWKAETILDHGDAITMVAGGELARLTGGPGGSFTRIVGVLDGEPIDGKCVRMAEIAYAAITAVLPMQSPTFQADVESYRRSLLGELVELREERDLARADFRAEQQALLQARDDLTAARAENSRLQLQVAELGSNPVRDWQVTELSAERERLLERNRALLNQLISNGIEPERD